MSWNSIVDVSHVVTVIIALVGLYTTHRLSAWRERVNHNRKLQTEFLIKAFRRLSNASHRPPEPGSQYFRDMETAVADIQLFGTRAQIRLIEEFTEEFANKGMAQLDHLLKSLRADLRDGLGYEPIEKNLRWFRPEGTPIVDQLYKTPALFNLFKKL